MPPRSWALRIVWDTIQIDLPPLVPQLQRILDDT